MINDKTKVAELETKSFQVMERLYSGVDVDLFSKTIISVVSNKHHRHPVIAGVARNLFKTTAIYTTHELFFSCRVSKGAGKYLPHATKR